MEVNRKVAWTQSRMKLTTIELQSCIAALRSLPSNAKPELTWLDHCACALPLSDTSLVTSSSQPVFFVALCPLPPMKARTGERHRPSSGLTCVAAHPRPPKKRKPSASGTRFCGWIDLLCGYSAGWFPTNWAPVVLRQLQHKEDAYRAAHPSWMDQAEAPVDIRK